VQTAYTVELTVFRRLLALGAALLRRFFVTRAAVRPAAPVTAPDGTRLTSHGQRSTNHSAVFGHVCCARPYCTAPSQAGRCPLDAELSLPARCDSDLRREWAASGATDASYQESQLVLDRILGRPLRIQALETAVVEAAGDGTPFYEQTAEPAAPRLSPRSRCAALSRYTPPAICAVPPGKKLLLLNRPARSAFQVDPLH
jgi:hypothetical protein